VLVSVWHFTTARCWWVCDTSLPHGADVR